MSIIIQVSEGIGATGSAIPLIVKRRKPHSEITVQARIPAPVPELPEKPDPPVIDTDWIMFSDGTDDFIMLTDRSNLIWSETDDQGWLWSADGTAPLTLSDGVNISHH